MIIWRHPEEEASCTAHQIGQIGVFALYYVLVAIHHSGVEASIAIDNMEGLTAVDDPATNATYM